MEGTLLKVRQKLQMRLYILKRFIVNLETREHSLVKFREANKVPLTAASLSIRLGMNPKRWLLISKNYPIGVQNYFRDLNPILL